MVTLLGPNSNNFGCKICNKLLCDEASDVADLPTQNDAKGLTKVATGSEAIVVATGDIYLLDSTGTWRIFG